MQNHPEQRIIAVVPVSRYGDTVELELLSNVVFRENFSGDDFGMSCRGFGG